MSTPPRFCSDYGKRVAKCQKCKMQLEKGSLRLGKIQPNFFIKPKDDKPPPDMKQYFHIHCLFEMLFKARPSTKVIDTTDEIEGFDDLTSEDQDAVSKLVDELAEKRSRDGGEEKPKKTPKKAADKEKGDTESAKKDTSAAEKEKPRKRKNEETDEKAKRSKKEEETDEIDETSIFNMFSRFTKVCEVISSISSQQEKSAVITALLNKKGFDGDLVSWLNFLIRENDSREFKVSNETLIQHFSKILSVDESELKAEFKKSKDVSLAIRESIEKVKKNEKSDWSIQKIDRFLAKLENLEDENDIATHFKVATKKLSPIEVQYLIRLVLKDLKINITSDSILRGVHKKAAEAFENDVSIEDIVKKYKNGSFDKKEKEKEKSSKKSSHHSRGRKDSESGDSEDDEMSESEESYVSDDEDDSDGEEMSESESSEEISSSSESEEDDEEADYKENKVKMPRGTRSRPAGNAEKKEKVEECPPDMEECRYGADCYRKNKQHKEDFWHPTK